MPGKVYMWFEKRLQALESASLAGNHDEVVKQVALLKQGAIALDDAFERVSEVLGEDPFEE